MEKISKNDLLVFKKLGIERYIDSMTIKYILPKIEQLSNISKTAKLRLKWMDYHGKCNNVSKTCRYFGIAPKTLYKWGKLYNPHDLTSLEDKSKRPKRTRQWQVTMEEERRIINLRKRYIRYGKIKLMHIYQRIYQENISSWKIHSGLLKNINSITIQKRIK
jgi:transposase-like protein